MTNNTKPLHCPFCGSYELYATPESTYVMCRGCDADGPMTKPGRAIKAWNTRAAPPEDVRAVVDERTPQDYAIEHAEYLAAAADGVQEAYKAYSLAQMNVDEGGDEGEDELAEVVDSARADLHEALHNLRNMTYEFRKRRDRATPQ